MVETIEVAAPDGTAEAYLAGSGPGVLLHMDAIGLRPRIAAMVEEIASWGYTVLAPNVFYRDGTATELAPTADLRVAENQAAFLRGAMARVARLTPDRAERDAAAWVAALTEHATEGPIGTTGYCMGARLALRTAGWHADRVAAVAGFHGGRLVTEEPDSPHLAIATSRASYVLLHADRDRSLTRRHVAVLEAALAEAGRPPRQRDRPGRPARLHDERHLVVGRGRRAAGVPRAARAAGPRAALTAHPQRTAQRASSR
ncbi:dienelactone hydrolase family protein [Nocardioides sp. TF02-7]|uniref:dienelactone hydrolase family protein n=1 Tax=Nocardioides sp. TF02-7 TaxID=2917724 RepID=UPI001F065C6D|nr:dienelactone hydrolase family protein [Nocardioides sp. TF02-7]UMG93392.1 dienelactone hydrolase family protein [Nocardioides sp. TF02-7]